MFRIAQLVKLSRRMASSLGTRVSVSLDALGQIGQSLAMKANNIVWTAVVSAVTGVASIVCAVTGVETDVVLALGLASVASALLATRER